MAKQKHFMYVCTGLLLCSTIRAQVQVSKEPMHRPVLENKYIRLLDVWLQPKDTTQFHVHSTPSLFVYLSSGSISSQVKGGKWIKDQAETGKAWYRSFTPDSLVHRVCNSDSLPFHVTDMEILSSYAPGSNTSSMPFSMLFDNEKAAAYELTNADLNGQIIQDRGPLIAQLASGDGVLFHDVPSNEKKELKQGQFLYINPGSYFSFTAVGAAKINLVVFEIK